jgi:hypothetical protein
MIPIILLNVFVELSTGMDTEIAHSFTRDDTEEEAESADKEADITYNRDENMQAIVNVSVSLLGCLEMTAHYSPRLLMR